MTDLKMNDGDLIINDFSNNSSQFNLVSGPNFEVPYAIKKKCPVCYLYQSVFSCKNCVVIGNFSHSKGATESYAKLSQRCTKLKKEKHLKAEMCKEILQKRDFSEQLPKRISECRERVQALKYLIQEKRDALKKAQKDFEASKEVNNNRRARLPRYRERVEKLASYVNNNMRNEINERRIKLEKCHSLLKKVVQRNIGHLVKYVFPIKKINPTAKSFDESEVVSALAEASKTSFVRGTWVLMDSSGELQHQIVAPTLPGSGDYSAYLAADNESGVPVTEKIQSHEAYNIGAALCYTTQLVNLLAFYLDVILPKRVSYADFCFRELNDRQFHRMVARLNTNVLYLCFSQGMDSVLLNPKHTLNNVLHLVQDADLGRVGPFQVDSGLILSLECESGDSRLDEGSEEEDEDQFRWDWEALPLVACPESEPGSAMNSTQATTSIAGGLVTSLASIFRGWTGSSK